ELHRRATRRRQRRGFPDLGVHRRRALLAALARADHAINVGGALAACAGPGAWCTASGKCVHRSAGKRALDGCLAAAASGPRARFLHPPLIEPLNHLTISARRVVEGTTLGQHRAPVKGASIEFRQHRFYSPGDDLRRLDWRVLGRTDRPYVKEYDEETNLRCLVMLDRSGSMGYRGKKTELSKFEYAAKLA